ncbi:MAG: ABC transporter permease [Planctomycetota bacterium]
MTLFFLVRKSLRQHALSTTVTILSVALAAGLVLSVFSLSDQTKRAFTGGGLGFDAVLGARSSKLQLVLNSVFHLEKSAGNLSWERYRAVAEDPRVKHAIPYVLGDNYLGFRVVGTTAELFTEYAARDGRRYELANGIVFDDKLREAVVGSAAARLAGLKVGSVFKPYHGLDYNPRDDPHDQEFRVVGILEPTNTPNDRVIWIPLEGVFRMEGHALYGSGEPFAPQKVREIPDEHKEVSAVMVQFTNPRHGLAFDQVINKQTKDATLAFPLSQAMVELFEKLGLVSKVLEYVAYLVVVVAAASILASIYNTMNERRREFAILRALGARRSTVFSVIVLEAGTIAALGSLFGFAIFAAVFSATTVLIREQTGVILDFDFTQRVFWAMPLGLTVIGALSGLVPAVKAYSTDVADHFVPSS